MDDNPLEFLVTETITIGSAMIDCNCGGVCPVCRAYVRMKKVCDDGIIRQTLEETLYEA